MEQPTTIDDVQRLVRERRCVRAIGGGSKSALHRDEDREAAVISTTKLSGMLEYDPTEFTFTAQAGTPLSEIGAILAEQGQYLPFDPPLVAAGATLGGTVAAGLSGSGRFAYGGLRDFILGVRMVNGLGDLVHGGGKVVKNAAGFDIPKLNVGALGCFGVLVELTFKVFPLPQRFVTLRAEFDSRVAAISSMNRLARAPLDLRCLDYEPPGTLWIRCGGRQEAIATRCEEVRQFIATESCVTAPQIEFIEQDNSIWQSVVEIAWRGENENLAKIPITPDLIEPLEVAFTELQRTAPQLRRRYTVGGHLLWIAWPQELLVDNLDDLLRDMNLSGQAILGNWQNSQLGVSRNNLFGERLQKAFDPQGKFTNDSARTI